MMDKIKKLFSHHQTSVITENDTPFHIARKNETMVLLNDIKVDRPPRLRHSYNNSCNNNKKKRFSLLTKIATVDPSDDVTVIETNKSLGKPSQMKTNIAVHAKRKLSKSSSFLHLNSLTSHSSSVTTATTTTGGSKSGGITRSRSMFGQYFLNHTSSSNSSNRNSNDSSRAPSPTAIGSHLSLNSQLIYASASEDSICGDNSGRNHHNGQDNILHTAAVSITTFVDNDISNNNKVPAEILSNDDEKKTTDKDQYLELGIRFYEKGELEKASYYWKLAAENRSQFGAFFYGLSLRHGWGCRKSSAMAVSYLQKAVAENSINELHTGISRLISSATKIQLLALSIYELGEFFWHGWEVPKNVSTAVYYFQIASKFGNPDAMNDLAFCYKYGHGVEKNDFKAAQLYRFTEKKGFGVDNNSWIWNKDYDGTGEHDIILIQ